MLGQSWRTLLPTRLAVARGSASSYTNFLGPDLHRILWKKKTGNYLLISRWRILLTWIFYDSHKSRVSLDPKTSIFLILNSTQSNFLERFIILFERMSCRERETFIYWFTAQMGTCPDLGQSKDRGQGYLLGFHSECTHPKHHPLSFQAHSLRAVLKVEQLEYKPLPLWYANIAGSGFIHYATTLAPKMNVLRLHQGSW